jgi:hypothetical protein
MNTNRLLIERDAADRVEKSGNGKSEHATGHIASAQ